MRNLLLAFLVTLPLAAAAQTEPQPAPSAECSAILARPFDGGLDPRIPDDCDSPAYYYGIGRDKDFAAARACAFIERFKHVDKDGSLFTGPGILSLVFANGEGTPRDLDLARRFVCENKEATAAEIEARLRVLDKIAADPQHAPHFSLCSTSSSGTTWGWCTTIQLRLSDAKRYNDMVGVVDKLDPKGQEAFKSLQAAEAAFETLRCDKEVDQNGQSRWAWQLQEQDRVRASFVADLKLFTKPDLTEPATFPIVDAAVERDYAKLVANGASLFRNTTITVAGVQQTQAAWLKYRDAWRTFEAQVNPTLSSDLVATQISRERLYHLHKLASQ